MTGVEKYFIYWPGSRNLGLAIHFQQNDRLGKQPGHIRTEYGEIFRIQSECGKLWTRKKLRIWTVIKIIKSDISNMSNRNYSFTSAR